MIRRYRLLFLLLAFVLAACAGEDAQPAAPESTTLPPTEPPTEQAATATSAQETAVEEETPAVGTDERDGRIYAVGYIKQRQHLLVLDLATGEESSLFTVPRDAWLSEVTASPDGQQLLLAYAPSPEQNQAQFGFTALYVMPADASSEPELLIAQEDPSETFFNISWPLEDTIYYAHMAPSIDDLGAVLYLSQIERAHLPGAEVEVLVKDAAWPRLSDDGARLAYVTETGDLMLSAANGSSPELLLGPETFAAVDAPLFSPDGSQLYFSAVDLAPATSLSPLDRLMGVQVAQAHSVPSDWWRLPVGQAPQAGRLTTVDKIGLYGDFDDDGRYLYFVAVDGVYVMGSDGQELTQLSTTPMLPTIDWTP
ncbi:MAG: TolB family protein [Candidatus Promineifilaceae bacterium]